MNATLQLNLKTIEAMKARGVHPHDALRRLWEKEANPPADRLPETKPGGLPTDTKSRAVKMIERRPGITAKEMAEAIGVNVRSLRSALTRLHMDGAITYTGNGTHYYYPVKK